MAICLLISIRALPCDSWGKKNDFNLFVCSEAIWSTQRGSESLASARNGTGIKCQIQASDFRRRFSVFYGE